MSNDAPERRGGVPDALLVGALGLALGITTLVWTATGLAGLLRHGAWPDGVTFLRTAGALRSFLTAPRDVAAAWPAADPATLPSAALLWLTFLFQLVVLFSTALWISIRLAHFRARRRHREPPAEPEPAPAPAPAVERAPEPAPPVIEPETPAVAVAVPVESSEGQDPITAVLQAPPGLVVVDPTGRLWARTARQRDKLGPVHVYDPGHATDSPTRLRWAPQRGCEDMPLARRRAGALLAPVRPSEPVFRLDAETAEILLRCYLHAAALAGEPIQQVHRWASGRSAGAPGKVLRTHPRAAGGASMELESALTAHPGRRDAALELIGRALGGLDQLHIRQSCTPGRVDTIALDNLAGEGGTLYVVGDQRETAALRSALVDELATAHPQLTVVDVTEARA
ncbi:type VI secretion protein [Streptomyces millisiae]|uniref:Type VI secretion protein n=1 Tax=Streptomyces millisiae TaxID=3075542 RepID=A0ABU2M0P4_9ACTN|nr:type VI secretion protein [Streptomyces sp. DSM 44918]MDT0323430.1 type VI secretion protein [Streptomyces sp. DSM 44918]